MCEPCKNDCHAKDMEAMNRLNQELQKVVDAAVEWWADPHDTTKTVVDLQNEVEAYWENHKTEKRFCECPGQTGAVSVNGCCVGCKLPIKFPPQKCTRDTDGDGNCWVHPQGCQK